MRVIEPPYRQHKNSKKRPKRRAFLALTLIVVIAGLVLYYYQGKKPVKNIAVNNSSSSKPATQAQPSPQPSQQIKTFSSQEFRDLYALIVPTYPNIKELVSPTDITGFPAADQHIRTMAERRGYKLRSVPVAPIVKINETGLEGDDLLQAKAYESWQELKATAAKDKIPIRLLSAYRSLEYQRDLFNKRMQAAGVSVEHVVGGSQDLLINQVLGVTAPPGYSRHHTGYSIDLACYPSGQFTAFGTSECYRWISANNYLKAKTSGWVPSYPSGTTDQGPEPEPWEYVWVGKDALLQK